METPSTIRRVTRSQAMSAINTSDSDSKNLFSSKKTEDSSKNKVKAQEERSALMDISNESPIVGLAMQTPPSGFMGKRNISRIKSTPGSGEALLRGQVKTLLQKVEEGTELTHSIKPLPFIHLVTSPMRLLAPTPANTPQFPNYSDHVPHIRIASPVVANADHFKFSKGEAIEVFEEEEEKSMSISRSLLLDFTEDRTLVSSLQVISSKEEDEVKDFDGLCEGMKKMSVETRKAEFAGKHSRFVYNSEDEEIVEAEQVLHLKGIPTPIGKHFRFATEEDEESSSDH